MVSLLRLQCFGLGSTLDSDVKVSSCRIPMLFLVSKVMHSSAFHLDYHVMQNRDDFIHDETRMWSWACDMRLQRGRSGLSFTFSLLLHRTLLAHQVVSTCPRVGSFSDITVSNVPKLPDHLLSIQTPAIETYGLQFRE